jgi:DNA mismatch endonuclease (patch repair protein)
LKFETTKLRSDNMRAIKASSNPSTEKRLRALLIRNRISAWKLRQGSVPGTPDFFFENKRAAVFVDGCFWHGCPKCGHVPKANRSYWVNKLERNKQRDVRIRSFLRRNGIRVLRVWECELRCSPASCVKRILNALESSTRPASQRRCLVSGERDAPEGRILRQRVFAGH